MSASPYDLNYKPESAEKRLARRVMALENKIHRLEEQIVQLQELLIKYGGKFPQ